MNHRIKLMELDRCTNSQLLSSKFPEMRGSHFGTPTPSNIRYRYLLTELNHCPNFHIAMSKFPEIRGLACCTLVARAQCIITSLVMHQRIALVELHQYAKFRVASSKFPESESACAYA